MEGGKAEKGFGGLGTSVNHSASGLFFSAVSAQFRDRRLARIAHRTIHGSEVGGLEKLARESDAHIAKVIIPYAEVSRIKEQLVVSGIDEVTIFPDLDGLGRFLTAVLHSEAEAK
jgi:hypothetical protein